MVTGIIPGLLVNGIVEECQPTGLAVKFMGLYEATIDVSHLPLTNDVSSTYKVGQKIKFRTLFCTFNTERKVVGGSLLPHILELDAPVLANNNRATEYVGDLYPYGTVIDEVKVARVNTHGGVYVSIASLEGVTGFVHVSRENKEA